MEFIIATAVNDDGEETTKLIRKETIDNEGGIDQFFAAHEGNPDIMGTVDIVGDDYMMGDVYIENKV